MRSTLWLSFLVVAGACGDGGSATDAPAGIDGAVDGPSFDARITFDTLQETGLCLDPACDTIAADVRSYTPRSQLWSDTAEKRRWIYLPPGTQIDTSDMDYWEFPIGTKLWKEFSRDGTRVETRLIQKTGPMSDDWFMTPYIWNASQDLATSTPMGQDDANGTPHDVPSRAECKQCHDRTQGDVLGFSAIQLDHPTSGADIGLADLVSMNLLTINPVGTFDIPGSVDEQAVLGYLHANCGHCHNPTSDVFSDITTIDLRMRVGLLTSADATPAWVSTINIPASPPVNGATQRVRPQDLTDSVLYQRFITTNLSQHMPKLGTEMTDPAGQAIIETWINGLPP